LVRKPDLKPIDFKDLPCIAIYSPKHPEPARTIRQICASYGFEPKFEFKDTHDSVVMAVESGLGYCIFDEWSRERSSRSFFSMPLNLVRPVSIFWRKDNTNPAIPIIVDTLEAIIKSKK